MISHMTDEKNTTTNVTAPNSNELSLQRTVLSHERTLMSWIRTATSMITFGFSIYKLIEEANPDQVVSRKLLTPRIVGMSMIACGLIGLLLAHIQHTIALRRLRRYDVTIPASVSSILAVLILIFGIALFIGAWFRQ